MRSQFSVLGFICICYTGVFVMEFRQASMDWRDNLPGLSWVSFRKPLLALRLAGFSQSQETMVLSSARHELFALCCPSSLWFTRKKPRFCWLVLGNITLFGMAIPGSPDGFYLRATNNSKKSAFVEWNKWILKRVLWWGLWIQLKLGRSFMVKLRSREQCDFLLGAYWCSSTWWVCFTERQRHVGSSRTFTIHSYIHIYVIHRLRCLINRISCH